jgi:hypothetical protein
MNECPVLMSFAVSNTPNVKVKSGLGPTARVREFVNLMGIRSESQLGFTGCAQLDHS